MESEENVMNTPAATKTDVLLLGLLLDRPMHGYELYQQIQAEGIDDWLNTSAASVYYSLRKLRDHGAVVESRQRAGSGASKSIYRLTEKGRSDFFAAMEAELSSQEEIYLDYDLAIYLLNRIPLQRAMPQLERRKAFLAAQAQRVQRGMVREQNNGQSPLKLAILDHRGRFLEMEQDWLDGVMQAVRQNGGTGEPHEVEHRGFMVLRGDLGHQHLPELIRLIASGQHSGTLRVSDGAEIRTLGFKGGQPVCASYVRQGDPPKPLSSCDEVLEGLCELFRWRDGRFTFDQQVAFPEWSVPLSCSAEELMLRGCRKVDNWAIIQTLVPSADIIFELGSVADLLERLELLPGEERVVAIADGVKDVATIARELDLTLFETSRIIYCLAAIGVLRTADLAKIRLRRVFREIAELMCERTVPWRPSPQDRSCEEEVNRRVEKLPIRLDNGRIEDRADPRLGTEELEEIYHRFLSEQFRVIDQRFGHANARQAFEQTLRQLAPELQAMAKRHGFDRLTTS
jgi:DNA-binding PadR family transcriptional regulator